MSGSKSEKHPAEEVLLEAGFIERSTKKRRILLGCIGCRWLKAAEQGRDATFYGYELMKCTKLPSGSVYQSLNALADMGAMVAKRGEVNPDDEKKPPRQQYVPADTPLGEAFRNALQVPAECPLEKLSC